MRAAIGTLLLPLAWSCQTSIQIVYRTFGILAIASLLSFMPFAAVSTAGSILSNSIVPDFQAVHPPDRKYNQADDHHK
ncbi:hypothetical protein CS542_09335 [Pedobacter sp. IW39]|nr:hypothetical protein CS542_09335 [Pedobacter sp. IW39]